MTRYHCPPDRVAPRALTDDEAYEKQYSKDVFPSWSQARLAAQAHAERMVQEARSALDRAKSLRDLARKLPEGEPDT